MSTLKIKSKFFDWKEENFMHDFIKKLKKKKFRVYIDNSSGDDSFVVYWSKNALNAKAVNKYFDKKDYEVIKNSDLEKQ